MKRKIVLWLMIILALVAMTGCKKDEAETSDGLLNQELMNLMPDEGFQWAYIGSAEYYHEMVLDNITKDEFQAIMKVTGEVEDVSGGDSNKDYGIEIYYTVTDNAIVQRKTEEMMLDSEYDEITIIKTPLEVDNEWTEEIRDKNGDKQTITAQIYEVNESDRGMEYKVLYQNKDTGYTESRVIMEGLGVIGFKKSVKLDGESYQYGYALYGKNSGYLASSQQDDDTSETTDTDDTNTDDADTSDADDTDSTDVDNDDSGDTSESTDTSEDNDQDEQDTPAVDEKEAVRTAIRNFNNAWIEYVNNNDQDFFDYVVKNSTAYNNAVNFSRDGLKEEFLRMDIGTPTINGKVATVSVYEEIEKNKDGEVTVAKYNWLYELSKVNDEWLVRGYTKK